MAITIKVNGSVREAAQYSLSLNAALGERATFNVRLISADGTYRPEQGHPIELWEGGNKLWAGTVDEVAETSITESGSAAGAYYDIRGVSWEQRLDRRLCHDITTNVPPVYDRNFVFTADTATDVITTVGNHGRSNGDKVRVKAHAQGSLCGGLDATIEYFVISATATTMKLSLTSGGSAVDITSTGTLDQILITYRAGDLVTDLVSTFAGTESIGTTNIDSGVVVDTIAFDPETSISQAISDLANLCGYVWWIDAERELYFKPRTYSSAPFSIGTSSANYRAFTVRRTREDKVNSALMRVPWEQIPVTEESFVGNSSARIFTLANRPAVIVSADLDGTEIEIGTWLAEDDKPFYWQYGSTSIRQDPDDATLTASNTLTIRYRELGANVIREEDSADVTATATLEGSGSGRYQRLYDTTGGQVQASIEGQAIIDAKKDAVVEISYETDQGVESSCPSLRPGMIQTIANSPRGVTSASYLIKEVSIRDVGGQWLKMVVKAISGTSLIGVQEYWKAMAGGGGTGGGSTATGTGGAGGSSSTAYVTEVTLTANTTITTPYPASPRSRLTIFVEQGAGPYPITFEATQFAQVVNTNISPVNGSITAFEFAGRGDGLWWPVALPITGLIP